MPSLAVCCRGPRRQGVGSAQGRIQLVGTALPSATWLCSARRSPLQHSPGSGPPSPPQGHPCSLGPSPTLQGLPKGCLSPPQDHQLHPRTLPGTPVTLSGPPPLPQGPHPLPSTPTTSPGTPDPSPQGPLALPHDPKTSPGPGSHSAPIAPRHPSPAPHGCPWSQGRIRPLKGAGRWVLINL